MRAANRRRSRQKGFSLPQTCNNEESSLSRAGIAPVLSLSSRPVHGANPSGAVFRDLWAETSVLVCAAIVRGLHTRCRLLQRHCEFDSLSPVCRSLLFPGPRINCRDFELEMKMTPGEESDPRLGSIQGPCSVDRNLSLLRDEAYSLVPRWSLSASMMRSFLLVVSAKLSSLAGCWGFRETIIARVGQWAGPRPREFIAACICVIVQLHRI